MEPINHYSLEDFAERHRADFDLHEPRPELWEMLEKHLDADAATRPGQPHLRVAADELTTVAAPLALPVAAAAPSEQPASKPQLWLRVRRQLQRRPQWGIVLGALGLVLALGLGRWHQPTAAVAPATLPAGSYAVPDAALYQAPQVRVASQGGPDGNARLDTAVHGMERYYAVQLAERQAQLAQLSPGNQTEWTQDIASLDSIYQQLKAELPQHPQPEAVLTAMNRNLQTRLDILDQQLALRGDAQLAQSSPAPSGEYALANSRGIADNLPHAH